MKIFQKRTPNSLYVPDTVLSNLHVSTQLILIISYEVDHYFPHFPDKGPETRNITFCQMLSGRHGGSQLFIEYLIHVSADVGAGDRAATEHF